MQEEIRKLIKLTESKEVNFEDGEHPSGEAIETWMKGTLRFGDEFPTICYALGISREELCDFFSEIYSFNGFYNYVKGPDWPTFENFEKNNFRGINKDILNEIHDNTKWNWKYIRQVDWSGRQLDIPYTAREQLNPVKKNIKRTPKKVLDVGAGRGTVGHSLNYCGVSDVVVVDNADHFETLCRETANLFFNGSTKIQPLHCSVEKILDHINVKDFDTIIFCEAIEHFTEKQIEKFWQEICTNFHGRVIMTNRLNFHPIPVNEDDHVREINNKVYDQFISQSKNCIFRSGSHLVLEF